MSKVQKGRHVADTDEGFVGTVPGSERDRRLGLSEEGVVDAE